MSYAETSVCPPDSCCRRGREGGLSHGSRCETHERKTCLGLSSRNGVKVSGCACVRRRGTGYVIRAGTSACPPDSWSRGAPRVPENGCLCGTGSGRYAEVGGWVLGVGCPLCCVDGWDCARESWYQGQGAQICSCCLIGTVLARESCTGGGVGSGTCQPLGRHQSWRTRSKSAGSYGRKHLRLGFL